MERQLELSINRPRCPYCHDGVEAASDKVACDACMSWHHRDCWRELGACGACQHPRTTERRDPDEGQSAAELGARVAPRTRLARLAHLFGRALGLLKLGLSHPAGGAIAALTLAALGVRWLASGRPPEGVGPPLALVLAVILGLGARVRARARRSRR